MNNEEDWQFEKDVVNWYWNVNGKAWPLVNTPTELVYFNTWFLASSYGVELKKDFKKFINLSISSIIMLCVFEDVKKVWLFELGIHCYFYFLLTFLYNKEFWLYYKIIYK